MRKFLFSSFLAIFLFQYGVAQTVNKTDAAVCFFWVHLDENLGMIQNRSFYDSIYVQLAGALQQEAGYTLKPVDELKGKIPFHLLGYPMASGKKASKELNSQTYLKFEIQIVPNGMFSTSTSSVGSGNVSAGKSKTKAKVKVMIRATVYNSAGKKIKKAKQEAISTQEIEISQEMLTVRGFGFSQFNQDITQDAGLSPIIHEACVKIAKALN